MDTQATKLARELIRLAGVLGAGQPRGDVLLR